MKSSRLSDGLSSAAMPESAPEPAPETPAAGDAPDPARVVGAALSVALSKAQPASTASTSASASTSDPVLKIAWRAILAQHLRLLKDKPDAQPAFRDFAHFCKAMGPRPAGAVLARVKSNKPHSPINSVWSAERRKAGPPKPRGRPKASGGLPAGIAAVSLREIRAAAAKEAGPKLTPAQKRAAWKAAQVATDPGLSPWAQLQAEKKKLATIDNLQVMWLREVIRDNELLHLVVPSKEPT